MRRAAPRLGLAAVVALFSAACSHTPSASPSTTPVVEVVTTTVPLPTTTTAAPHPEKFEISSFEVAAVGDVPEGLQSGIEEALDRYLDNAVLRPLRTANRDPDLSDVFADAVKDQVAGPDRAALVDDLGRRMSDLLIERATAAVVVLGPGGGRGGIATARIDLLVRGMVGPVSLTVERSGDLLLAPEGETWKITGYRVSAKRDTTDAFATTTVSTA